MTSGNDAEVIRDLKAKSDRLRRALRECVEAMGGMHPGQDEYWRIVDRAEEALKDK